MNKKLLTFLVLCLFAVSTYFLSKTVRKEGAKTEIVYDDALSGAIEKLDVNRVKEIIAQKLSITRVHAATKHALDVRNKLFRTEKKDELKKSEEIYSLLRKASKLLFNVKIGAVEKVKETLKSVALNEKDIDTLAEVASDQMQRLMKSIRLVMPSPGLSMKERREQMRAKIDAYKEVLNLLGRRYVSPHLRPLVAKKQ